jgi:hypothetical protein
MKKAKNNDYRSKELTNVRSIPLPAPGLRTCCSGYIMEQEYNKQWQNDRMERLKEGTNYFQSPLNPIYIPVNKNVLDLRMIRNNNLQQTLMDMQSLTRYVNSHTFYDPVLEGPPMRRNLYSGNNFYINLM